MHYLRNSNEIREQLSRLFSGNGKKWAVVGFVGYNALDQLPRKVSDLSVVCWPKAGGTNPDGVRRLIDHGISVYFCDRLHQKVYWRQDKGLIVTSANLSENALGGEGLHEFGVYCDDEKFDIREVLAGLDYAEVTPEALAKLDIEHAAEARRRSETDKRTAPLAHTFQDALRTKYPRQWKLITWTYLRDNKEEIEADVEAHFGCRSWVNDNDIDPGASFEVGDFVLQVRVNEDDIVKRANARWLFVDHVVKKRGTRAVVQVKRLDGNTPPPFTIDSNFKAHLKEALNKVEWDDVYDEKTHATRPEFVQAIAALYP